jgi:hypothetical protein
MGVTGGCARILSVLVAILSLVGCGGGSGSGGASSSNGFTFTLSSAPVSVHADTASGTISPVTITGIITNLSALNAPATAIITAYASGSWLGLSSVTASFGSTQPVPSPTTQTPFTITINLWPPAVLGAGVYSGDINFQLCLDQHCTQPVAGTATTIRVTYTVTGSTVPSTTFSIRPTAVTEETPSNAATAPSQNMLIAFNQNAPTPYVNFTQPADGFIASLNYQQVGFGGGTAVLTFMAPSHYALGSHSENIQVTVCYDPQCAHPLAGSPITVPVTYNITASAGTNYTVQTVNISAADIAWDAATQKLYAVSLDYSAVSPDRLVEIDPTTAAITRSVALPGSPTTIALTDDGAYAYVGFSNMSLVQRIPISTLAADISIALGGDSVNGPYFAGYLAPMPGTDATVAVSRTRAGYFASGQVAIYDGTTARANSFGATNQGQVGNSLAWAGNATALIAYEPNLHDLFTLNVGLVGLTQINEAQNLKLVGVNLQYANSLLYTSGGQVVNPTTGAPVGTFVTDTVGGALALDLTGNRAYMIYQDLTANSGGMTLGTFNLSTYATVALARLPQSYSAIPGGISSAGRLVRWGSNGLATNTTGGVVILSGAFVAP